MGLYSLQLLVIFNWTIEVHLFKLLFIVWDCSKTYEYEKGLNVEKVEQMKVMEKDLVGLAEEVERLRAEVSNAEKAAHGNQLHL